MASDDPQLFPEAYRSTITTGTRQLLPAVKRWWWLLVLVALTLLAVSFPVWWRAVSDLSKTLSSSQLSSPSPGPVTGP